MLIVLSYERAYCMSKVTMLYEAIPFFFAASNVPCGVSRLLKMLLLSAAVAFSLIRNIAIASVLTTSREERCSFLVGGFAIRRTTLTSG